MVFMENYNNKKGNWSKPQKENFHQYNQVGVGSRPRSQNNRPSFSNNNGRQPPIPSWEKEFCFVVGRVSWGKLLDFQCTYKVDKVLQWEDSAVEEAFWNAKNRFWAKKHGQQCDIKLPDPDLFIDKVDWDSIVDPELMSDLENRELEIPCGTENHDGGGVIGIPVVPEQYDITSGWGDAEEWTPQSKSENRELEIPCETEKQDGGGVLGIPVVPEQYALTSGWGDAEEWTPQSKSENRELETPCETEKQDGGGVFGIPVVPEQYVLASIGRRGAEDGAPQSKDFESDDHNGRDHWDYNGERGWEDDYVYVTEDRNNGPTQNVYNKKCNYPNWNTLWYKTSNRPGDAKEWAPKPKNLGSHDSNAHDNWDYHGERGRQCNYVYVTPNRNNGSTWDGYNKKNDHRGNWNTSRYKNSRFHNNGNGQRMVDDIGSNRGNFAWRPVRRQL